MPGRGRGWPRRDQAKAQTVINGKGSFSTSQASVPSHATRRRQVLSRAPGRGPPGRVETAGVHARALLTALGAGPRRLQGRPPGARGRARTEERARADPCARARRGVVSPLPQRAPSKQKPRQETSKRASGAPVPVPPGAYLTGQGVACVTFRPGPGPGPHFPAQDTAAAVPGERGWVPEPGAERPPLPRFPPSRTAFRGPSVIWLSAAAVVWAARILRPAGGLGGPPAPAPRSQGSPHHRPAQGFGFRRGTCHPSWSRLPAGSTSQRLRPTSGQPTGFILRTPGWESSPALPEHLTGVPALRPRAPR